MKPPASTTSPTSARRPIVLLPACQRTIGEHRFQVAGEKYVEAVRTAGCLALVVPGGSFEEIAPLLDLADGILLTGSQSNVDPRHFSEQVRDPALPLDPDRDAWTLPLIPQVLERGMPLLSICRGLQEMNVALGGALEQAVHQAPDRHDHRAAPDAAADVQYGPAHDIIVQPGGVLEALLGAARFKVNSVHFQGVGRLASGLRIEALAPDGLVEAFSVTGAPGFNLAVQWHPEWQAATNPVSMKLLAAFGAACVRYRDRGRRRTPGHESVPDR